jgi:nucleotide-binding universal stress UspA family protein
MVKSILLTIDGSTYSEGVLQYGIELAKKFKAYLRVLTVVDIRFFESTIAIGVEGFAPILPSASYQEDSQKLLNEKADEILKKVEEILKSKKVQFSIQKESGNPVDVICEKSRLVDLVIMGARGEFERWSDKMLGTTLEATSRLNIKPILVTPKKYQDIKKILIAYDGSNNSIKALTFGAFFSTVLQADVILLNVKNSDEISKEIIQEAKEYLSNYEIPAIEEKIVEGEPTEKIVEVANTTNSNLIIMGAYGHSRIREAILGSTTVQVMRKATMPILMSR